MGEVTAMPKLKRCLSRAVIGVGRIFSGCVSSNAGGSHVAGIGVTYLKHPVSDQVKGCTSTSSVFVVAKAIERKCLKDHARDGYVVVDPATLTPAERAEAENNSRN
jgi:hypothetical protein